MTAVNKKGVRQAKRSARLDQRAQKRDDRWEHDRYAVPYRTDGPRISLAVLWFSAVVGAAILRPALVALPVGIAAAVAGFQTGHAWLADRSGFSVQVTLPPLLSPDAVRFLSAGFALLISAGGLGGVFGLGLACVVFSIFAVLAAVWFASDSGSLGMINLAQVIIRSSVPVGLAAGSLTILAVESPRPFLVMFALVSAYEAADYLVGTGTANPVEGPFAGLAAVAVAAFALRLIPPDPLTAQSLPFFALLTGLCCVIGQLVGSVILPRGGVYATGLRRLDSYLLTAPLWMLLT